MGLRGLSMLQRTVLTHSLQRGLRIMNYEDYKKKGALRIAIRPPRILISIEYLKMARQVHNIRCQ